MLQFQEVSTGKSPQHGNYKGLCVAAIEAALILGVLVPWVEDPSTGTPQQILPLSRWRVVDARSPHIGE